MLPTIQFLGHEIAMYGSMILIGVVLSIIVAIQIGKIKHINKEDILFAFFYGLIGVAIGGKVLYLLVNLKEIILYRALIFRNLDTIKGLLTGGFVFYGGLIGGMIGAYRYCKRYDLVFADLLFAIIPIIPLLHGFGRIGCFCAGCCYGIPYSGLGSIQFSHAIAGPNHIQLFPVQLVESGSNFVIFLILLILVKRKAETIILAACYGILYGIMRFVLEFYRGDVVRGSLFQLATSQWISLFVVAISFYIIGKRFSKKNSKNR